ncbi:PAS domain S-box protein [Patescibacteria group bacterium]|nr:PAS domain S-box protein [Patescibacteria group bacterium]
MSIFGFKQSNKSQDQDKKIALLLTDLTSLEDYINDLFSFSPLPICFISPLGVILETNPAFESASGFPGEEIIGESIEKIFIKEEISNITKETLKEGFVAGKELSLLKKDGNNLVVRVFTRTRTDENLKPIGYFLGLFDLSNIKKTEEELKRVQKALLNILEDTEEARRKAEEEKDKTQAIITNFADGLLFFDKNHNLAIINPKAENFFKTDKEKIIGKTLKELINVSNFGKLIGFLGPEIKDIFRKELIITKDFIIEVSAISMKKDEIDLGNLVVLHDVSREKTIEKLKTEFVSLAAHQLRTPLSAVKWSLRMVLDGDMGKINKEQKEIMEKTYQSNERMIALVNDLLNVARIEEGKYAISPTFIDMVKFCQSTVDSIADGFKKKGIKFKFIKSSNKPIMVFVDEEKLELVIQNLLDNALKYTNKPGEVVLSLKETPKTVTVEVKDSGIGITKGDQARIFSKFFRASEAILIEPGGSGLGLYMAKNIINSHNGKIGFESQSGQGSTFYFTIKKQK